MTINPTPKAPMTAKLILAGTVAVLFSVALVFSQTWAFWLAFLPSQQGPAVEHLAALRLLADLTDGQLRFR